MPRTSPAGKRTRTARASVGAPAKAHGQPGRPEIVHSSLYLPEPPYDGLLEAAFKERCKIHDIVLEMVRLALRKRGLGG
jgi:hypothetical protein